jgi:hypothetical protein
MTRISQTLVTVCDQGNTVTQGAEELPPQHARWQRTQANRSGSGRRAWSTASQLGHDRWPSAMQGGPACSARLRCSIVRCILSGSRYHLFALLLVPSVASVADGHARRAPSSAPTAADDRSCRTTRPSPSSSWDWGGRTVGANGAGRARYSRLRTAGGSDPRVSTARGTGEICAPTAGGVLIAQTRA